MAVVMDPANGEVLALANYPSFDPEKVGEYAESGEMERAKIHCIANLYEPGSTIKPFVVAAGLESGVITLDTKIDCQDGLRFLPKYRSIPIKDEHQMGEVPVTEVLVFSSNVGIGKIAERIVETPSGEQDRKKFYDYLTLFGFGAKTGIELPGETQMILRPWSQWNLNDMLVVAFGTGPVMASPLGLAGAYCILANGGWQVSPHVIRGYLSSRNGSFYPSTKGRGKRVISAATAKDVQNMLLQVVERGTGTQARSGWYETGGKTGTAKKVVDGVYSDDHRVLSFAGFAPKNPPRIVVVVMIDEPEELRFGGQAAAPVFRQIVEETLAYLHVPPDMIPSSGPKKKDKAPGRHEQHKPVPASPGSRPPFATTWAQPEESHRVNHRLAAADLLDPSQKDKAGWSAREPQTEMARRAGQ
jgi:cell division protein FtsI (penicillin-binding protein 3)